MSAAARRGLDAAARRRSCPLPGWDRRPGRTATPEPPEPCAATTAAMDPYRFDLVEES